MGMTGSCTQLESEAKFWGASRQQKMAGHFWEIKYLSSCKVLRTRIGEKLKRKLRRKELGSGARAQLLCGCPTRWKMSRALPIERDPKFKVDTFQNITSEMRLVLLEAPHTNPGKTGWTAKRVGDIPWLW